MEYNSVNNDFTVIKSLRREDEMLVFVQKSDDFWMIWSNCIDFKMFNCKKTHSQTENEKAWDLIERLLNICVSSSCIKQSGICGDVICKCIQK